MATIFDVAQRIHMLRPGLTKIELYKLCFFAQGWHTAWTGQPLFSEEMQAWKYGPVSPELRRMSTADNNKRITGISAGNAKSLSDYECDVVERIEAFYKETPAFGKDGMSSQSHGLAWKNARGNLSESEPCAKPIAVSDIRKEFTLRMWDDELKPQAPTTLPPTSATQLTQARMEAEAQHRETLQGLALV